MLFKATPEMLSWSRLRVNGSSGCKNENLYRYKSSLETKSLRDFTLFFHYIFIQFSAFLFNKVVRSGPETLENTRKNQVTLTIKKTPIQKCQSTMYYSFQALRTRHLTPMRF